MLAFSKLAGYGSLSNGSLLPTPLLGLISWQATILIGLQRPNIGKINGFHSQPPASCKSKYRLKWSAATIGVVDTAMHTNTLFFQILPLLLLQPFSTLFFYQCPTKCEPAGVRHLIRGMQHQSWEKCQYMEKSSRAATEHKFSAIYHLSPLAIPSSSIPGITGSHLCVQVSAHMSQTYW